MTSAVDTARPAPVLRDKSFWSTFLIGVAVIAGIDEIVFHQLLGWHHLYDLSTPEVGLVSDGLLHAAELIAIVAGFFLFADARRRGSFSPIAAWAGFFVGGGLFQLWDGTINHKLLRLHQVRYDVDLLPYDLAWNAAGFTLLASGAVLTVIAARRRRASHSG
ncbi:DUF2243 domain-containing protein [Marisediminicola senii]|uniref:DUF2243 domain-containing protein n=1 Tax=Marisediminicola senii TaxID=2711233 RepID=UPI0013EE3185|nr:DUF2243 domain-containing protein [Marisediminicola senii]